MTNCKDCSVMEILLEFERNLYKTGSGQTLDALQAALRSQQEKPVTAKKMHRCTTTCAQPGCMTAIHYPADAKQRNLYCSAHMKTHAGRNVRKLI